MPRFVQIRNRFRVRNPQKNNVLHYGGFLKLRYDPHILDEIFGNHLITSNRGLIGFNSKDTYYSFQGDITQHMKKIPVTMFPNAGMMIETAVRCIKGAITTGVTKLVSEAESIKLVGMLHSKSNKIDDLVTAVATAFKDGVETFRKQEGYDLTKDPIMLQTDLFNQRGTVLTGVSNSLKNVMLREEQNMGSALLPYAYDPMKARQKSKLFRSIIEKKLDQVFPTSGFLNWVLNQNGAIKVDHGAMEQTPTLALYDFVRPMPNFKLKSGIHFEHIRRKNGEIDGICTQFETTDKIFIVCGNKTDWIHSAKDIKETSTKLTFWSVSDRKKCEYEFFKETGKMFQNSTIMGHFIKVDGAAPKNKRTICFIQKIDL